MFCASCGKQVNESYKFCDGCGVPVKAPAASPVPEPAPDTVVTATSPAIEEAPVSYPQPAPETTPAPEPVSVPTAEQPLMATPEATPVVPAAPVAAAAPATQTCPSCGKQVNAEYRFCDGCGSSIQPGAAPATPSAYDSAPYFTPAPGTQPKSGGGLWIVLVLVLILLAAGGGLAYWKFTGDSEPSNVDVAITPSMITVAPGASQTIEASVTGTDDTEVEWRLQEGAVGGEIAPAGATAHGGRVYSAARYTAPGTPGVYHAIATSKADPKKAAGVTITVR